MARLFEGPIPDIEPRPEFEQKLRERLLDELRIQQLMSSVKRGRRMWIIRTSAAAAAMVLVVFAGWLLLGHETRSVQASWSSMMYNLRQNNSVVYELSIQRPGQPKSSGSIKSRSRIFRTDWNDGRIEISDYDKGKTLVASPSTGKARYSYLSFSNSPQPLAELQAVRDAEAGLIGKEVFGGKKTLIYQMQTLSGSMAVWVDMEMNLPVKIELNQEGNDGRLVQVILHDFRWNVEVSDAELSMAVPEGFVLDPSVDLPTEGSLIECLAIYAHLANGQFPKALDAETILGILLSKSAGKQQYVQAEDVAIISERGDGSDKPMYRRCLAGLAFARQLRENGTWHYRGESVRLGQKETLICLWRQQGERKFRAIYGDLAVRDIPSELAEKILSAAPGSPAAGPQGQN